MFCSPAARYFISLFIHLLFLHELMTRCSPAAGESVHGGAVLWIRVQPRQRGGAPTIHAPP